MTNATCASLIVKLLASLPQQCHQGVHTFVEECTAGIWSTETTSSRRRAAKKPRDWALSSLNETDRFLTFTISTRWRQLISKGHPSYACSRRIWSTSAIGMPGYDDAIVWAERFTAEETGYNLVDVKGVPSNPTFRVKDTELLIDTFKVKGAPLRVYTHVPFSQYCHIASLIMKASHLAHERCGISQTGLSCRLGHTMSSSPLTRKPAPHGLR